MHANTSDGALAGHVTAFDAAVIAKTEAMHLYQSSMTEENGAAYDVASKAVDAAAKPVHTAKDNPCPDCGWPVVNWWSGNQLDPGDVDPRADCTNPDCLWGY